MDRSLFIIEFSVMTLLGSLLVYDHAEHKGDEQLSDSGVVVAMISAFNILVGILSFFVSALAA